MLKMRKLRVAVVLCGLSAVAAYGADAAAGKALFATKCRACHGADYQGNPSMAKALKAEIKPLDSAEVQKMSDADLKKVLTEGMGKMKAVAGLAAADADNLVAFLRTLKK
jgi:mono/diheme cytochrome c family protein